MDIIKSMLKYSNVQLSFWTYTLRTLCICFNRIHGNPVPKAPYELWTGRKDGLRYLHVQGYQAKVKVYNLREKVYFYSPNNSTRIIEFSNARFIENCQFIGSKKSPKLDIMKICEEYLRVGIHLVVLPSYNKKRQQIFIHLSMNVNEDSLLFTQVMKNCN